MANSLAVRLDRHGAAEMSCIAGLGGDIGSLVRLARSGRPILALDGCALVCVESTLRRHGLTPDAHVVLSRYGVRKRKHADFDQQEADQLFDVVVQAADALAADGPPASGAGQPPESRAGRAVR
jgi:uncharacterized metal-binding protein